MKKILLIHTHGGIGGAGQSLVDIVKALIDLGLDVTVACPKKPDVMCNYLKKFCVKIVPLDKPLPALPHYSGASASNVNLAYWRSFFSVLKYGKEEVERILSEDKYDVVVVNSLVYAWVGKYVSKEIPVICFHRETYVDTFFNIRTQYLMKELVNNNSRIVFISKYDKDKTKYLSKNQGVVIPDCVDIEKFNVSKDDARTCLNLETATKYILFVGGTSRIKGAHVILNALKYIKDSNVKILLGPWNESDNRKSLRNILNKSSAYNIKRIIEKYNLEDRIVFFEAQEDMSLYYCATDVVVFPSVVPHQGRPIYEAGAAHKTIVVSDFKETKENLIDRFNGLVFKAGSSKDLASKLNCILEDGKLKTELENNNYYMTCTYHDSKKFEKEIKQLFTEVKEGKRI